MLPYVCVVSSLLCRLPRLTEIRCVNLRFYNIDSRGSVYCGWTSAITAEGVVVVVVVAAAVIVVAAVCLLVVLIK